MEFTNAAINVLVQTIALLPLLMYLHWIVCKDARNLATQQAIATQATEELTVEELAIEDLMPIQEFMAVMDEAMNPTVEPAEEPVRALETFTRAQLLQIAKENGYKGVSKLRKAELVELLSI